MSVEAKRELLFQVAPRYREATHKEKSIMLKEFLESTGYARKYAIRLLSRPVQAPVSVQRTRPRRYGPAVQEALAVAWSAAHYICAKRLIPFLPELIPALERHGHLVLSEDVRERLLELSPATADRLLRPLREEGKLRGISTTRRGTLLKHQVPVRTFADWIETEPGFLEADLVAHCGHRAEGAFLYTLVLTDVATGWTECLPLLFRTQEAVVQGLERARALLPMALLGLDTDNGSEFLNAELMAYCQRERVTFTRGRAYRKNDQCYVEQKNGSIVRHLVGYDRFEGEAAYRQLAELYRAVRLYVNYFQPSMKLRTKHRDGARVRRTYESAQTPFQRLVNSGVISQGTRGRLEGIYRTLDPVRLLGQLQALQDALWRHGVGGGTVGEMDKEAATTVRFGVNADQPLVDQARGENGSPLILPPQRGQRAYRRPVKPRTPRTWRTRIDPFETVWGEITQRLEVRPEQTARSVLEELQVQHPGQYSQSQLRTLQRRVKEWRARALLRFDDQWLGEDTWVEQRAHPSLWATTNEDRELLPEATLGRDAKNLSRADLPPL